MRTLPLLFAGCLLLAQPARADDTTKKLVEGFAKQLDDKNEKVRLEALEELSRFGADARPALPAIAKALKEGSNAVRLEAAKALARLATHAVDAIPALMEALRKD